MLRGCQLADTTKWVLGLVIYTGFESKIYMNNKSPAPKVSYLGRQTNRITLQLFVMMCCVCAFAATYHVIVIQVRREETRGRRATPFYHPPCTGVYGVYGVYGVCCSMAAPAAASRPKDSSGPTPGGVRNSRHPICTCIVYTRV